MNINSKENNMNNSFTNSFKNQNNNLNDSNNDSFQAKKSNYDSQTAKPEQQNHNAYVSINVQLNEFIYELMLGEDPEDPIVEFEEDRKVLGIPNEYDSYQMSNHGFLYQTYSEKINFISDNFNETFFNKLEDTVCVNELTQFLIRDKNELWKFMFFLFSCLKHVEVEKECFQRIAELIYTYNEAFLKKNQEIFTSFFNNMFFGNFVDVYQSCDTFEKKIHTAKLLYSFYPEDPKIKIDALKLMKLRLNNLKQFIQFLGIIVKEEQEITEENYEMINEIKYYASSAISSRSPSMRLSAFSLMNHLVNLDFEFVQSAMVKFLGTVNFNDWWEIRVIYLVVISSVLRKLIASEPYKAFIKKEAQSIGRSMNDDAEFLVKNIRDLFDRVAESFRDVVCKNVNENVSKIALVYFSDLISENKNLTSVYLELLLQTSDTHREWALHSEEPQDYEYDEERYFILSPDSQKYKTHIRNQYLKKASGEILMEMSKKIKGLTLEKFGMNYIDVLTFSLENAEFDKLNVEILDSLINNSLNLILKSLLKIETVEPCTKILTKFLDTFLKGEAMISEFDQRLSSSAIEIFNLEDEEAKEICKRMFVRWSELYGEESALFDQFGKIIGKVVRKVAGSEEMEGRENEIQWFRGVYGLEKGFDDE